MWLFFSITIICITIYAIVSACLSSESDKAYWDRSKEPEDEA